MADSTPCIAPYSLYSASVTDGSLMLAATLSTDDFFIVPTLNRWPTSPLFAGGKGLLPRIYEVGPPCVGRKLYSYMYFVISHNNLYNTYFGICRIRIRYPAEDYIKK